MVVYLLRRPEEQVRHLGEALIRLKTDLKVCSDCGNISESAVCHLCSNPLRDPAQICVVEDFSDQVAVESTGQFKGRYHILGGLIAPIDGVGPEDLNIASLLQRVQDKQVQEIILALNPTPEGDTTMFYLARKLRDCGARITAISRGISMGAELDYTDEITLGRSILNRTDYQI
jgi:recombination protein RecR